MHPLAPPSTEPLPTEPLLDPELPASEPLLDEVPLPPELLLDAERPASNPPFVAEPAPLPPQLSV